MAVLGTVATPLADAKIAASAAPLLTYRGGPLLTAVEVTTLFLGSGWQRQAALKTLQTEINAFFDFVLTSSLIDQLSEYSVAGKAIGHGMRTGSVNVPAAKLGKTITDAAIQTLLQEQIALGSVVKPTVNTLYFIYVPPGVRVVQGGSASCQAFCGYHNNIGTQIFYAVMPYPGCSGCTGGLAVSDALTSTSSHELCEAITDPIPGQGWYDDSNGEIGDICAWKTKKLGAFTVQLEWSNKANACI